MIVNEDEFVVFTAENGSQMRCRLDNRGQPSRKGLSIDFHDTQHESSVSIFLDADEASTLGDLIERLFKGLGVLSGNTGKAGEIDA
ncbi:hypothetical protein DBIPINDM_001592 [Mesorhizobium sp. AR02]|uniref:hypothetical protein n=1 Tax=Mesorhizobium sp. AR02 TaxID=2865837 RepID=UPI00215F4FCC|nr:hypothetical protein [Mesorhizobium sp. AR02]UVK55101.1 hypothetical protein DBIPINDM_001592 [Mesorhizobium sp. AR02]